MSQSALLAKPQAHGPFHITLLKSLRQLLPKPANKYVVPFEKYQEKKLSKQALAQSSNQVLLDIDTPKNSSLYLKKTFTYYVPTYIRLVIKNFTNMDLSKLEAEANVTIIITFVYGNDGLLKLPEEVAARLYNQVMLNFQRDDSLRLTPDNDNISVKEIEEKSQITFTVRRKVHMRIEPEIHFTPFEKLNLIFPITIQQLPAKTMFNPPVMMDTIERNSFKYEAIAKFNFMERPGTRLITIDCNSEIKFGNYSIIENSLRSQYSGSAINKSMWLKEKYPQKPKQDKKDGHPKKDKNPEKEEGAVQKKEKPQKMGENRKKDKNTKKEEGTVEKKIKYCQYSSFEAAIYKQPMSSLFNIFLPLWGLALINLIIYFQQTDLDSRIASIATLMVAFIALDDNIRAQIPPHSKVLFIQYLVYAQITSSLVCLLHSFALRNTDLEKKREFEWLEVITLAISAIILVVQVILVIARTIYHYNVEVPNFRLNELEKGWKTYVGRKNFNHLYWENQQCDKQFVSIINQNKKNVVLYNCEWTKKLEDLNDQIKRKSTYLNFSYVKPNQSMIRDRQPITMGISGRLKNQK